MTMGEKKQGNFTLTIKLICEKCVDGNDKHIVCRWLTASKTLILKTLEVLKMNLALVFTK